MNLLELKDTFKYLSGRYDLFDGALGTANIVRTFLNSAIRRLDRATNHQKSPAFHLEFVDANNYITYFPYCRSLKEVWVHTITEKWQLIKKPLQDIISEYYSDNTVVEAGTPIYYAPVITRTMPEGTPLGSFSSYLGYFDSVSGVDQETNAIVIAPPTDTKLMVDLRGLFYSRVLTLDTDENYWSVNHPLAVVKAALREVEVFNQNASKVKIWSEDLAIDMLEIEKDLVEEDISEIDQIED